MYADDTVLYFTSLSSSEINKVVQDDLNGVAKWIKCNKLILNHSKTKTILFWKSARSCEITKFFNTATWKDLGKGT